MLGCSGTGFDRGGAERSGSALGEENAVDTGAISNAKKSAKVLRVFNAVEREKEPSGSFAGGVGREEILKGEEFLWADERDDALMSSEVFAVSVSCSRDSSRTRIPASRHWATR